MRYFFYTRIKGVLSGDETGEEFDTRDKAIEAAHQLAGAAARDYASAGRAINFTKDEIVVTAETGTVVATVPLARPSDAE